MDQAEIIRMAGQLFQGKLDKEGDGIDLGDIQAALGQLVSGSNGNLDLGSLLSHMKMGSLAGIAASWLGDDQNESISTNQVSELLDADKISAFAAQLGISESSALNGLTEALPEIVDKSSSGGSLLDSVGGMEGVLSMAGKLFGR